MLPTQQAAIATYVLLTLIAVESIVVYRIETREERAHKRQALWEAREQHKAAKRAAAGMAAAEKQGLPVQQHELGAPTTNGSYASPPAAAEVALAAAGGTAYAHAGAVPAAANQQQRRRNWRCWGKAGAAPSRPTPLDVAYDAWKAYAIDKCSMFVLLVLYVVTVILIYALQSGYIDLWA